MYKLISFPSISRPHLSFRVKNNDTRFMENKLFLLIAVAACIQLGCGKSYFYEEKKDISGGLWTYGDTLDFQFSMRDTARTYNLYVDFDYADTFATQNIYIRLHTLFPDGKRLTKVMPFDFFDNQGKPLGTCSGRSCRLHAVLQERAFFNQPGEYRITLEQYTRRNPLPGVRAVGVSIETADDRK